jgi:carbonic anhydrase
VSLSPTALSLRHLRDEGWTAEVVERWNPHARIRQDLFGFVDLIAIRPGETLAVQTTSAGNVASRVRKIGEHANVAAVREAGWAIRVHGWAKRKGRWVLARDVDVS